MIWQLTNLKYRDDLTENRTSLKYRDELDENFEMLVRAADETEARQVASRGAGDETAAIWLYSSSSTCTPIDPDGPPLILAIERKGF